MLVDKAAVAAGGLNQIIKMPFAHFGSLATTPEEFRNKAGHNSFSFYIVTTSSTSAVKSNVI